MVSSSFAVSCGRLLFIDVILLLFLLLLLFRGLAFVMRPAFDGTTVYTLSLLDLSFLIAVINTWFVITGYVLLMISIITVLLLLMKS